jgi:predicted HAD superfamily Cof-like phosphohydrolase
MKQALSDVRQFLETAGQQLPTTVQNPNELPEEKVRLRLRLIAEEFVELLRAHAPPEYQRNSDALVVLGSGTRLRQEIDPAEVADALADLVYVICNMALEYGIPLDRVFAEVHRSNMAKFVDGVKLRPDGKILKPDGWQPPDIRGVMGLTEVE